MRLFFSIFCALWSFHAAGQEVCSLKTLQENLDAKPEIVATKDNSYIIETKEPKKFISIDRRVPCSEADLLKLGFEIRTSLNITPVESTGGGFEAVTLYQRKSLAVRCFFEYGLDKPGQEAKITWSRTACQQVVPVRVRQGG
jgi:hypothetical protein